MLYLIIMPIENVAFQFSEKCLDEYLLYRELKGIRSLKSLYVRFNCGITPKGLQELSDFVSNHHTLQQFSVKYGGLASSDIRESIRVQSLVKVAMSCSSLKAFCTNVPCIFQTLPANIELFLFEIDLLQYMIFKMPVTRLFDCLCSIADLGKLSSVKYLFIGPLHNNIIVANLPIKVYCDFLALVKSSLHSNPLLGMKISVTVPIQLHSVSRALRRNPDLAQLKLRRSKSLCDLQYGARSCRPTHHSCPDLLELQALHNMHPHLCTALGARTFDIRLTVKEYLQEKQKQSAWIRNIDRLNAPSSNFKIPTEYVSNSPHTPTPDIMIIIF